MAVSDRCSERKISLKLVNSENRMNTSLKFTSSLALLCGATFFLDTAGAADRRAPHNPAVNHRQHEQPARIHQGVKSGELTKGEVQSLRGEERAIRQEERDFKSDGKLTPEERAKLQTDLNKTSKDIYNEKHDADKAIHDPLVNRRQSEQQARIRQGVKSGELTKGEVQSLRGEERAIRQEERQFKSDGKLTVAERQKLNADQNKASKDIYDEKHDADKRVK